MSEDKIQNTLTPEQLIALSEDIKPSRVFFKLKKGKTAIVEIDAMEKFELAEEDVAREAASFPTNAKVGDVRIRYFMTVKTSTDEDMAVQAGNQVIYEKNRGAAFPTQVKTLMLEAIEEKRPPFPMIVNIENIDVGKGLYRIMV